MSAHDYKVIQSTPLSGFKNLPADLKSRFLSPCPRSVRAALAKLEARPCR